MLKVDGLDYSCGTIPTEDQIKKLQYFVENNMISDPHEVGVIERCEFKTIDAKTSNVPKQVNALREPAASKRTDKKFLGGHLKNVFDGKHKRFLNRFNISIKFTFFVCCKFVYIYCRNPCCALHYME
jgi:hypothetical protein